MKNMFPNTNFGQRLKKIALFNGYDLDDIHGLTRLTNDFIKSGYYKGAASKENIRGQIRKHLDLDTENSNINSNYLMAYTMFFNCSSDYLLGFIDTFTHENKEIKEITGLNEKSIRSLKSSYLDDKRPFKLSTVLNPVLNDCPSVLSDIYNFTVAGVKGLYKENYDQNMEVYKLSLNLQKSLSTLVSKSAKGNDILLDSFQKDFKKLDTYLNGLNRCINSNLNSQNILNLARSHYKQIFNVVTTTNFFRLYPKEFVLKNINRIGAVYRDNITLLYDKDRLKNIYDTLRPDDWSFLKEYIKQDNCLDDSNFQILAFQDFNNIYLDLQDLKEVLSFIILKQLNALEENS